MPDKPDVNKTVAAARPTRPKVFISYSWTSKDRAIDLADRLLENGIEVVIDVYDLKDGMDKYAFMQRIANDASIEKVLLLCDRAYKEKADSFKGGVGDEAMIVSPEIYGKTEQQKFIPIVLEVNDDGKPYLPTIVGSRIYIDFSNPLKMPEAFNRLVRNLWNKPDRRKPKLGERPTWLDTPAVNTASIRAQLDVLGVGTRLKPDSDSVLKRSAFEITKALNELCVPGDRTFNLLSAIKNTEPLRNCYVDLVDQALQQKGFDGEKIGSLIETMYNGIDTPTCDCQMMECYHFFFWDIFICTAALMLCYEKYGELQGLLNRTYFLRNIIGTQNDPSAYSFSQFRQHCRTIDGYYKNQINPNLVSLAADILIKREYGTCITKRTLVTTDTTLAHLAMLYGKANFTWYPVLAAYSHYAGYDLIWSRLVSRSFCRKLFPLFGVTEFDDFKRVVKNMSDDWDSAEGIHNSSMCFGGIYPVLGGGDYEKIGTMP